jgi:hypothetical protein
MKGVELPINTLIIVAIAVIVLLALVALYFTGFTPFTSAVGLEGVRDEACRKLAQLNQCREQPQNIKTSGFDADQDGKIDSDETGSGWRWRAADCGVVNFYGDNLASLCQCYYNIDSDSKCKTLCGCPGN